jgi:hypothetical protein
MLRKLATLTLLAGLLAPAALGAQTEIPGTVIAVDGFNVTIQIPGDLLPRQGDEVRLRFRDPVEGAGLVFLDGTWEVTVVRRDDVVATPRGQTARPQEGLVALITSNDPQTKDALAPEPPVTPPSRAQPPAEPAVAATVRDRDASGVERIDRRRWLTISAGAGLVGLQSPTFYDFEPAAEIRPALNASVGLHLLPNLALSGYLGAVSVDGEDPDGNTDSAAEIYKALGATLYFGTPGNVPGDVHTFVQGGLTWFDVHYGGASGDPDVTGTGFFAGGGLMVTLRRGFGLYFSGRFLGPTYDATHTVFQRIPVELGLGATVIM